MVHLHSLKNQILLLVLIPLALECLFVGSLLYTLGRLEAVTQKESQEKQLIAITSQLELALVSYVQNRLQVFSLQLQALQPPDASSRSAPATNPLLSSEADWSSHIEEMKKLAAGDRTSLELIDRIGRNHKTMYENRLKRSRLTLLERLTSGKESLTEINTLLSQTIADVRQLVSRHRRLAAELSPQAQSARQQFRLIMTYGVIANILVALAFSFFFASNIIKRLQHLMYNVENFGKGDEALTPVGGLDEIGQLDESFRQVAKRKLRAERLRKEMMSMVSHDLRSPLSSVRAYLHMLEMNMLGPLKPQDSKKAFANIDSELSRLLRLSDSLLDVERLEEGALDLLLGTHKAEAIVSEAFSSMIGASLSKEIELVANVPDADTTIYCDGERTVQVLINLLSNALKYAPTGSKIFVNVTTNDATIRFEVQDQGPGISADDLRLIFARFTQLDQPNELKKLGSGLGLSLCKTIVERQRGEIGVVSAIGQGTTFWFTLPRTV